MIKYSLSFSQHMDPKKGTNPKGGNTAVLSTFWRTGQKDAIIALNTSSIIQWNYDKATKYQPMNQ